MHLLSKEERRAAFVEVGAKLIVPTAVVLTVVFAAFGAWIYFDGKERADANRVLIDRITDLEDSRAVTRARLKRTDVLHCREIEKLKAGFRVEAIRDFKRARGNAALLGIEFTPQLQAALVVEKNRTLRRYAARPGGCGTLPSSRPIPPVSQDD